METRSKYEGCDPQIAEALKNHKYVKAWVWSGQIEAVEKLITDYNSLSGFPYICWVDGGFEYASLTDPRVPKKGPPPVGDWVLVWDNKRRTPSDTVAGVLAGIEDEYNSFSITRTFSRWLYCCRLSDIKDPEVWPDDLTVWGPEDVE